MMEVEDISLVPRTVKCSYKAVTDNRIRTYIVELHPSSICLPVSQCNEVNYSRYAEEGGLGGCAEEGWSNGSEAEAREILRARILRDEAARGAGLVEEDADVADPFPAEAQAQFTSAGINEGGAVVQARNIRGGHVGREEVSAGDQDRRRKGKGILVPDQEGPTQAGRILKASSYNSGSDLWDPIQAANQPIQEGSSFSSKDADSTALPKGAQVLEDLNVQPANEEDIYLGGEGGGEGTGSDPRDKGKRILVEEVKEGMKVKKEPILGGPSIVGDKTLIVISDESDEGGNKGRGEFRWTARELRCRSRQDFKRSREAGHQPRGERPRPLENFRKEGFVS